MPDAGPPRGPVKLVILPRTLAGLGRAGLRRHLETVHGPLVMRETEVSQGFTSYVHHYALDIETRGTVLDGRDAVTIIRFADFSDLVASKAGDAYRDVVGPDEDNFREIEGSVALFVDEAQVRPGADATARKLFVFRAASGDVQKQWTDALGDVAARLGLGAITNAVRRGEGEFAFSQFDEIGLPDDAEADPVLAELERAAARTFGPVATACLLTQPVRFL